MPGDIVVVVSDLHIGAGRYYDGNALEDFISDNAFASLVGELARESESAGRNAELVVNGDFVEFLQAPRGSSFEPGRTYPPADYGDMSAAASAQKLRHIVVGHPTLFAALRDWLRATAPHRRLIITKGNHDPQWHWSAVQDVLREAVGATGDRRHLLDFPAVGYSRPGLYVEHGNQYTESANRFSNFAEPLSPADPTQLETPWGSKFVIEFFNFVEREKYWVDGVKPYAALVWYSLKYDPVFAFRALVAILRAAPRLLAVRDEIRDSWLTNLQTHPELAAQRYQTDAAYRVEVNTLLSHVLEEIEPAVRVRAALAPAEDPRHFAVEMEKEQDSALAQAALRFSQAQAASVVLFGHTHRPLSLALSNGARYLNTGCWVWQMDLASASDNQWRELFANPAPYAAYRRLNYARVDYDASGVPSAQLLEHQPAQPIDLPPKKLNWLERLIEWIKKLFGIG